MKQFNTIELTDGTGFPPPENGGRIETAPDYIVSGHGVKFPPPENGGRFLKAIADPKAEDHDRFLEWSGPFDAETFDADKATKAMRRGLPDWRQK